MKRFLSFLAVFILLLTSAPINAETIDGRFYPVFTDTKTTPKSIDNLVGHFDHKVKIIFSDIDGTIIPFSKTGPKGIVPESAKKAAEKLKQAQIPLILATGRSSWEGRQIAKKMGNEKTYIIGQQGAEIIDPEDKLIYEDTINNKDARKMIKEINSFNKSHNQDSKMFLYVSGKLYMTEKYNLPYLLEDIVIVKSFNELNPNFAPIKIGICDTNPKNLKLIQTYLKEKFPNYHVDLSADCYCDLSSATATKGNAVKKLAEILKIDLKDAATLGDAENDISMLKQVGTKGGLTIVTGNAMDSVKSNANFVTSPVSEGGFAKAIDKILANNALIH